MATNHDDDAPTPPESEAKASPDAPAEKPVKPAAGKPAKPGAKPARPAAAKTSPEKRVKPPAEKDGEEGAGETGVPAKGKAKGKKKAKAETGITTKPGLASLFTFRQAAPAGVWGIDLGQCALKAIRLEVIDGEVTATAFDYVEHPKILSQPDADPDELTREALQKFLSRNTLRGDTVAISVPGQSGLARFVKLPPVEEKKIPDIVRFEAKQQIPFNLEEVVWDYQKLGVGELAAGFVETEIGLFAMKRDMVNRYLQHFKDVGVEVHLVQMAPLALCNFVAYDLLGRETAAPEEGRPRKRCVTALDIGADSSNLVITDGGRIIWQRPIPLGGNHFTRALTKDLKLTFAKAEHLKRNAVKSPDLKRILAALKPVLSDFVGEVQRSLGYFTNTHRDAQIEYMVGLGNAFRLPGLQRYLAEKLQMEVRKLGKMERLHGETVTASATYTENILSFAVAYGLALQGLRKTKLQTNLLPGEIRAERAVRGKKPWAVAAAALLLFGIGALGFSSYLNYESYAAQPVLDAVKKATDDAGVAKQKEDAFTSAKTAAQKEEEAVKSIIAGQAERKNWLEFTHYLFAVALPNPDGSNLSDTAKQKYWAGRGKAMTGEEAYKNWLNHVEGKGGAKPAAPMKDPMGKDKDVAAKPAAPAEDLPAGIDDLVQVNIEFFDQRYTDDLAAAWTAVKRQDHLFGNIDDPSAVDRSGLEEYVKTDDRDKAPEGKGWVVELHGYTYHNDPRTFLAETLLDNIWRLAKPAASTPPVAGPAAAPTPPAATSPPPTGVTPAPGQPAAADKDKDKADQNVTGKDIYRGRISHVTLFDINDSNKGSIVGQSVLDGLVKGGGAASTPGAQPSMPGSPPMGNTGTPTGSPNASGTGGPGGMNMPSSPVAAAAPASAFISRDGWRPLSPFMAGGGGSAQGSNYSFGQGQEPAKPKAPAGAGHARTEFVVVFFWREPAPSDKLREPPPPPPKPAAQPATPAPAATPPSTTPPASDEKPLSAGGGLKDLGP